MTCALCGEKNPEGSRYCQSCGGLLIEQSTDPSSLVGKLVGGRYHVTRVIGEGGMGVVYEAEQRIGGSTRKVAIKTLLPSLSSDAIEASTPATWPAQMRRSRRAAS